CRVISDDLTGRPHAVAGAQLVQQKWDAIQSRARPHALTNAGNEPIAVQPDRVAPAIRKRDSNRKRRLRQIGKVPVEVTLNGWKCLVTRRLKLARRAQSLERSLGGERLLGLHREAARHWTEEHDGANRRPVADHRFLGETSAVG